MLGTDNVKLTKDQMARVLDTIDKEQLHERLEKDQKEKLVVEKDDSKAAAADSTGKAAATPQELEQEQKHQRDGG